MYAFATTVEQQNGVWIVHVIDKAGNNYDVSLPAGYDPASDAGAQAMNAVYAAARQAGYTT